MRYGSGKRMKLFPGIQMFAGRLGSVLVTLLLASCGSSSDAPQQPSPPLGDDPSLSALTISDGTLNPVFTPSVTDYAASVPHDTDNIDVSVTASDSDASVTINGGVDTNTPLSVGDNTISILVTAENGTTKRTYTIVVTRAASDNASLRSLALSNAAFAPAFERNVLDYVATVGFFTRSTQITAITEGENAIISVNGTAVTSGVTTDPIALTEGSNTITVNVTAEDGVTSQSYTIAVTRQSKFTVAQTAYVKASNTDAGDAFGWSVSLSGDGSTLAVGAQQEDSAALGIYGDEADNSELEAGAVYVYVRDGAGSWIQEAYVKASERNRPPEVHSSVDLFGASVALSNDGNTLAVGAPREGGYYYGDYFWFDGTTGAVYLYARVDGVWTPQGVVTVSGIEEDAHLFGKDIALSADGTTLAATNSYYAGAVYVFSCDSGFCTRQAHLKFPNNWDLSLDLSNDGSTLVVGDTSDDSAATGVNDDSTTNSGAVYLFTRDTGDVWSQAAFIKPSNVQANERFGRRVALSGDGSTLAVQGFGVYLFAKEGEFWEQLDNIGGGGPLALSDDGGLLAMGVYWDDSSATGIDGDPGGNSATDSGAVYLFARNGEGNWNQQTYLKASNTDSGDLFGGSIARLADTYNAIGECVALSADATTLVVGAIGEDSTAIGIDGDQSDNSAEDSGAVYTFELQDLP